MKNLFFSLRVQQVRSILDFKDGFVSAFHIQTSAVLLEFDLSHYED